MSAKSEFQIVRVPMLDTGLGREAGFKDDAELIAHCRAKREAMGPVERAIADEIDRRMDDELLNGC